MGYGQWGMGQWRMRMGYGAMGQLDKCEVYPTQDLYEHQANCSAEFIIIAYVFVKP